VPGDVQTVTALAAASPKETFAVLTEEQVNEKATGVDCRNQN
jgi:hypothetical protein